MRGRLLVTTLFGLLGGAMPATALGSRLDGSCLEAFELENFQPLSPTFHETVESTSYRNRTTIVMLLVGS